MDYIKGLASLADKALEENGSLDNLILKTDFDYKQYISYSDITYKKILLFSSQNVEIYIICWKTGQKSRIHNHPDKGCVMIIMEGMLLETKYIALDDNLIPDKKIIIKPNETTYNYGSKILHQIEPLSDTVSLHIYHTNFIPKYY